MGRFLKLHCFNLYSYASVYLYVFQNLTSDAEHLCWKSSDAWPCQTKSRRGSCLWCWRWTAMVNYHRFLNHNAKSSFLAGHFLWLCYFLHCRPPTPPTPLAPPTAYPCPILLYTFSCRCRFYWNCVLYSSLCCLIYGHVDFTFHFRLHLYI